MKFTTALGSLTNPCYFYWIEIHLVTQQILYVDMKVLQNNCLMISIRPPKKATMIALRLPKKATMIALRLPKKATMIALCLQKGRNQ
ncbi:uncharacterized protein LOC125235948 isoform X2 [Leguminivora glycinivorella]|uniref:uncharacterized protein LOC125235948 isoform X2 n=1 Tax=Leguminivora glycinivorella TaxID=1035111 RepID=UPI00200BB46C|nr:uncharacterized protein LOC125235948 isoform X2 [Leguminivora glycinivorella]